MEVAANGVTAYFVPGPGDAVHGRVKHWHRNHDRHAKWTRFVTMTISLKRRREIIEGAIAFAEAYQIAAAYAVAGDMEIAKFFLSDAAVRGQRSPAKKLGT